MKPEFTAIVERQRDFFTTGITKDVEFRVRQLKKLGKWVGGNRAAICRALREDLGKSATEAGLTEIAPVMEEILFALRHVRGWAKPERVGTGLLQMPGTGRIYSEPYGTVLIMSPWNYPFLLTIAPLVGALAAGNCVTLKPSAYSPAASRLLSELAAGLFDSGYVSVIPGGRKEIAGLLEERFDYIFFTGSTGVGKVVMRAAAEHLTPVSLELGGKSPCIVDETAGLKTAAKRIAWGKTINAGQTCVAPDYLLVHEQVKDRLLGYMRIYLRRFYGEDPASNPNYPKIVTARHYDRLTGLLEGVKILYGGSRDPASGRIAPAVVEPDGGWNHPLMREEIFGPILPVLTFRSLDDAVRQVAERPKPLALYLFTENRANRDKVLTRLSFGGGCVNDTVLHLASPRMPFGGVGDSGMGRYHGKHSFQTFSHRKSVLTRGKFDLPLRYPPYR